MKIVYNFSEKCPHKILYSISQVLGVHPERNTGLKLSNTKYSDPTKGNNSCPSVYSLLYINSIVGVTINSSN